MLSVQSTCSSNVNIEWIESITDATIQIVNCLIYQKKQSLLIETHA